MIDKKFLDGIDLRWGNVDGTLKLIERLSEKRVSEILRQKV